MRSGEGKGEDVITIKVMARACVISFRRVGFV